MAVRGLGLIRQMLLVALVRPPVNGNGSDKHEDRIAEKCPYCGAIYAYEIGKITQDARLECQNCGRDFHIVQTPKGAAVARESGPPCPSCGYTMERGYIVGPAGVYWSYETPHYGLHRTQTTSLGPSSDYSPGFFHQPFPYLAAFICDMCRTVLIRLPVDEELRRAKECPYCAAVYEYHSDKIAEDGSVQCQNCGKRFGLRSIS